MNIAFIDGMKFTKILWVSTMNFLSHREFYDFPRNELRNRILQKRANIQIAAMHQPECPTFVPGVLLDPSNLVSLSKKV